MQTPTEHAESATVSQLVQQLRSGDTAAIHGRRREHPPHNWRSPPRAPLDFAGQEASSAPEDSAASLLKAVAEQSRDAGFSFLADRTTLGNDAWAAFELFVNEIRPSLPPADAALLEVRLSVCFPELRPDIALACESSFARPFVFTEFLREVGEKLSEDERDKVGAALLRRFPSQVDLFKCLTSLERRLGKPNRALKFGLLALEAEPQLGALDPRFWFGVFQSACQACDLEQARNVLEGLAPADLSPRQQLFVLQFLVELREWTRALDCAELLLKGNNDFSQEQMGLIIRMARGAQGQHRLLKALAGREDELSPCMKGIAEALYQDWVIGDAVEASDALRVAQQFQITPSPLLRVKLAARTPKLEKAIALSMSAPGAVRRAVLYCADGGYALPALVSLYTLLSCNPRFHDAVFHLAIDDGLIPVVEPVLDRLRKHYAARVLVQPCSDLSRQTAKLRSSYGMFTGGQTLAAAAYYRIYMAAKLAETGELDQILYVDSDSMISYGFDDLLELPYSNDTVMMARVDDDTPSIREATCRHGLQPGRYFNSGVLWFPRVDGELIRRLRAAAHVAENRSQELMYHDQCALNIAFAGVSEPLPERFNFFTGSNHVDKFLEAPPSQSSMYHMYGRLKPWDSAYPAGSPIQLRWLNSLSELQRVVGESKLRPLLARAFG